MGVKKILKSQIKVVKNETFKGVFKNGSIIYYEIIIDGYEVQKLMPAVARQWVPSEGQYMYFYNGNRFYLVKHVKDYIKALVCDGRIDV